MIRFLIPLLSGVLISGLASAAPLTIDDFSHAQGPISSAFSIRNSDTVVTDGSFVGSTRTIEVLGDGTPPPSGQYAVSEIGGDIFEFTSAVNVTSSNNLIYDGIGGLDLSKHNGFTFHDLLADHPFDYNVSVVDTSGALSVASGTFSMPLLTETDFLLSFSMFAGDADFTSIDKLIFGMLSNERGLDVNMSRISAAIPIPAAGFFLVTALAGLGLLRSRRMTEAA